MDFDASSSISPLVEITDYTWVFGNADPISTTETTISHTFTEDGEYDVVLTITDGNSQTGQITKKVTVAANKLPIASFTSTMAGYALSVTSTSTDPDGDLTNYKWNFGDSDTNGSDASTASHTYTAPGSYPVSLSVVDNDTATSAIKTVYISTNVVLNPSFTMTQNGLTVSVDASASTSTPGTVYRYEWDWGDDSTSI